MIAWVKKVIRHRLQVHRFPESTLYFSSIVDENSSLGKNTVLFSDSVIQNSDINDYTYVQKSSVISSAKIGRFCSIASHVHIGLANHPMDMVSTSPVFYDNTQPLPFFFTNSKIVDDLLPSTTIESDVWIGQGAMIKSGLKIGVGAVVGAGAVVVKNVAPYSVVAGVPAKHIKWRFSETIRHDLLDSRWWLLSDERLKKISQEFCNPDKMLSFFKK